MTRGGLALNSLKIIIINLNHVVLLRPILYSPQSDNFSKADLLHHRLLLLQYAVVVRSVVHNNHLIIRLKTRASFDSPLILQHRHHGDILMIMLRHGYRLTLFFSG